MVCGTPTVEDGIFVPALERTGTAGTAGTICPGRVVDDGGPDVGAAFGIAAAGGASAAAVSGFDSTGGVGAWAAGVIDLGGVGTADCGGPGGLICDCETGVDFCSLIGPLAIEGGRGGACVCGCG